MGIEHGSVTASVKKMESEPDSAYMYMYMYTQLELAGSCWQVLLAGLVAIYSLPTAPSAKGLQ